MATRLECDLSCDQIILYAELSYLWLGIERTTITQQGIVYIKITRVRKQVHEKLAISNCSDWMLCLILLTTIIHSRDSSHPRIYAALLSRNGIWRSDLLSKSWFWEHLSVPIGSHLIEVA